MTIVGHNYAKVNQKQFILILSFVSRLRIQKTHDSIHFDNSCLKKIIERERKRAIINIHPNQIHPMAHCTSSPIAALLFPMSKYFKIVNKLKITYKMSDSNDDDSQEIPF